MKKVFTYFVYAFAIVGFVLTSGFFAVKFGLTNEKGIIDKQRNSFIDGEEAKQPFFREKNAERTPALQGTAPHWTRSEEWAALKEAILRDQDAINRATKLIDVEPRLLVSLLIVEQLRLFNDNRELFKTVFAPLKILGNQSQFSWGVMGIKQETAIEAEHNLRNPLSPFYAGQKYEHVLDFTTPDSNQERFTRLVNEDDRFYSYLYAAVIVKEVMAQWKNAGYDINKKPSIVATLYNIGFKHSQPNADPKSGGADITLGTTTYSFGSLSLDFYNSNELLTEFPR